MTETNATSEYCCTCQSWQNEIVECGDPVKIARKVRRFLSPAEDAESAEMEVVFCCFSERDAVVYENLINNNSES